MSSTSVSCNLGRKNWNYRVAIANTINRYCLTSCIFEKVWYDDASSPKSVPNSDTLWTHLFLNDHTRGFSEPQVQQFCRLIEDMKTSLVSEQDSVRKTFIIFKIFLDNEKKLSIFNNLQHFTNSAKFKSCVNFGTPFIYIERYVIITYGVENVVVVSLLVLF